MKSAEELFIEMNHQFTTGPDVDECRDYLKKMIKEIQLDAWKQGMKSAADLVMTDHLSPSIASYIDYVSDSVSKVEEIKL